MNHHQTVIELLKNHFGEKQISGIEIGTGGGSLPAAIMLYCKNVYKLITIDPWKHKDGVEFEASWTQEALDNTREAAIKRLAVYSDRVSVLHMASDEAFNIIEGTFDFVWIDGDHTMEQVERDLRYEKFVNPGGFIGGHDFGQVHPMTEMIKEKYGDRIHVGEDFTWYVFIK